MQIEGQPMESNNDPNSNLRRSFIKGEHLESCQNDLLQLNINIRNHLMELKSIKRNLGKTFELANSNSKSLNLKLEDNPENRLRDIKEQLESKIEYMEEIYEARINEAYKAMQEQKLLYERKIESLQKALTESESSQQMMRSNIALLTQNISEYEKVNQNLEIKLRNLTANANNLSATNGLPMSVPNTAGKNPKNTISETVLEKIKELQNRLQKLKEDKDSGTQIIESQRTTIKTLEMQNNQLKLEVQKLSVELEEAKVKSKEISGAQVEEEGEHDAAKGFFQKYENSLMKIENFYLNYNEIIEPLKERLDQYYAEIHKLNDEAMELKRENSELRQMLKEQKSQRERGSEDKSIAMEEERPNDERMNEECQPEENSQGTMRNNGQFSKWKFYQEMMTKFQEIDRLKEAHQSEISKLNQENEGLRAELKEMKEKYEQALLKNQESEKPSKSRKNTKKVSKNSPQRDSFKIAPMLDFKPVEMKSAPVLSQSEKTFDDDHEDENKDDQHDSILRAWKEKQAAKREQKPKEDGTKKLYEITICTNCNFLIRKNEQSINCRTCQGFIHQKCVRDIDKVGDALSCQPCFVKLAMKKQEDELKIDDIKEEME